MTGKAAGLDPILLQRILHFGIAVDGGGIVKAAPVNRPCPGLLDHIAQNVQCIPAPQDQTAALFLERIPQTGQRQPQSKLRRGPQGV